MVYKIWDLMHRHRKTTVNFRDDASNSFKMTLFLHRHRKTSRFFCDDEIKDWN